MIDKWNETDTNEIINKKFKSLKQSNVYFLFLTVLFYIFFFCEYAT